MLRIWKRLNIEGLCFLKKNSKSWSPYIMATPTRPSWLILSNPNFQLLYRFSDIFYSVSKIHPAHWAAGSVCSRTTMKMTPLECMIAAFAGFHYVLGWRRYCLACLTEVFRNGGRSRRPLPAALPTDIVTSFYCPSRDMCLSCQVWHNRSRRSLWSFTLYVVRNTTTKKELQRNVA